MEIKIPPPIGEHSSVHEKYKPFIMTLLFYSLQTHYLIRIIYVIILLNPAFYERQNYPIIRVK